MRRSGRLYLPTQGLDDASGRNVPGAPEHDMECLAALIVPGLRVGVAVDGLHLPLIVLECHFFVLLFFRINFLFALPLARRRTFLMRLLLFLAELFYKLLDLSTLTRTVAHRVMHRATGAAIITAGRLAGVLVLFFLLLLLSPP
jgi:hypothetical protein